MIHSFESQKVFLFVYSFHNSKSHSSDSKYSILSMKQMTKNNVEIIFSTKYSTLTQYYIIASKKDNINNINTFSNPCHIVKLLTQNSDLIIVKTFFGESYEKKTFNLDIKELNTSETDSLIVTIMGNDIHYYQELYFFEPKELELDEKEITKINIGEKVYFNSNNNLFKLVYRQEYLIPLNLTFSFDNSKFINFCLVDDMNNIIKEYSLFFNNNINITLDKSGIYYFQFHYRFPDYENYSFKTFLIAFSPVSSIPANSPTLVPVT